MANVEALLRQLSERPRSLRTAELLNRSAEREQQEESGLRDTILASLANEGTNFASGPNRQPFTGATLAPSGVLNPVPGASLSDSFGAPRSGGRRHQGIDIMAELGTPVVAPVDGVAERGGYWSSLGGNSTGLRDAQGNWHYFTHMNEPSHLQPGQFVPAGTVIGYVGMTGNAAGTSPHLHYSINEGRNNVINAFDFLTTRR